jgi:hypothetical protein
MSVATAAGFRDIAATSMRYVPAIYSGKLLIKFYDATVLSEISNTDYEGEIKEQGDTVYIRSTPDITIRPYKKGQTLVHEQPTSAPVTLLIDQAKYWAFVTNKVDEKQTDIKSYVDKWTTDAAEQLKISIDTDILGAVYADVDSYNKGATAGRKSGNINLGVDGGTAVSLTKTNILDYLVDCGTVLDEQNIPETGRFFVLPPWAAGLIKKSDLKDASLAGDGTSIMRNGRLGMIDRFTLYSSNLLGTSADSGSVTCTHMLFGHKAGLTFASQLTENENLQNPYGFGRLYRGLQVFGYKVVKATAMGDLFAKKG